MTNAFQKFKLTGSEKSILRNTAPQMEDRHCLLFAHTHFRVRTRDHSLTLIACKSQKLIQIESEKSIYLICLKLKSAATLFDLINYPINIGSALKSITT